MTRLLACLTACLLVAALTAVSARPRPVSSAARCQRGTPEAKGAEALRLIRYPIGDLHYTVAFLGPRRGVLGLTRTGIDRIEVYVRPCQPPREVAAVLGHELGHAIDDRLMTPERRGEYLAVRGISGEWFGCQRCSDYRTPAGDYAEVAASLFASAGVWRSQMAPRPSAAVAASLRRFFYPIPSVLAPPPSSVPPPVAPAPCRIAVGQTCLAP